METKKEIDIKVIKDKDLTVGEIASQTNLPITTIVNYLNKLNKSRKIKVDLEDESFIPIWYDLYTDKQYTIGFISEMIDDSQSKISRVMSKQGVQFKTGNTPRKFNMNFFRNIDTEKQAMLMGMFHSKSTKSTLHTFAYRIPVEDINLVLILLGELVTNILDFPPALIETSKGEVYIFTIGDRNVVDAFNDVGIFGYQSENKLPEIPEDMETHFVRGYLTHRPFLHEDPETGQVYMEIRSYNKEALDFIAEKWNDLGIDEVLEPYKFGKGMMYILESSNPDTIEAAYDYIYTDANYYSESRFQSDLKKIINLKKTENLKKRRIEWR